MQFRIHALPRNTQVLRAPLKRFSSPIRRTACASHCIARRSYSSASDIQDVAVLGGGITGLAAAHYLARELPKARITVYEKSSRVGGWLESKTVDTPHGEVVFEQGPRTIRQGNTSLATVHLIQELGIQDLVIYTGKDSPAARNRYIYYPDHLVRMPGPGVGLLEVGWNILTEPIFQGTLKSIFGEGFREPREPDVEDESLGSFCRRRFGSTHIADNLASAIMHGIYAGDIYQLSAKSLMPFQWWLEGKYGSLMRGLYTIHNEEAGVPIPVADAEFLKSFKDEVPLDREFLKMLNKASVFSFVNGIQTFITALEESLENSGRVTVRTDTGVERIEKDENSGKIQLYIGDNQTPETKDFVVSTLVAPKTAELTTPNTPGAKSLLPTLKDIHAVSVMVVNLYFPDPNLLPVKGFGYLIPRSIPFEQNPERALGVIFDSDALPGQDGAKGTKVTVMMGGHWWDGWTAEDMQSAADDGVAAARTVLARHLGITADPAASHVALQRDCIPQYTVGHERRLRQAHQDLRKAFGGRVVVAGSSYTGVGVNDCVRAARDVARTVAAAGIAGKTGLERFGEEQRWTTMMGVVGVGSKA